jgi:hypothetical protein
LALHSAGDTALLPGGAPKIRIVHGSTPVGVRYGCRSEGDDECPHHVDG